MPKISIITPAYNCEKYLPDAVKSVLSQTFTDWELLIIDDCSKDNTYRYMKKLAEKDKRIRILFILFSLLSCILVYPKEVQQQDTYKITEIKKGYYIGKNRGSKILIQTD